MRHICGHTHSRPAGKKKKKKEEVEKKDKDTDLCGNKSALM